MTKPEWVLKFFDKFKRLLQSCYGLFRFKSFAQKTPKKIFVYSGPGAGPLSLKNMISMLRDLVTDQYSIEVIDQDTIINGVWTDDTALLVMPGGADLPYVKHLNGIGNQNIRKYALDGGKFLGVCAGSYYAGSRVEFAKGDPVMQVCGERELKFYPDLVEGPTHSGFHYDPVLGQAGQRAATVYWQNESSFAPSTPFVLYYNGGGHFVNAHKHASTVTILARYKSESRLIESEPAAIVECKVGKGSAILSGLHFEWDPDSVPQVPELTEIRTSLLDNNSKREELAIALLGRLGITTRDKNLNL